MLHKIITISGTPGSGKSTIAKILADKLNAERLYVGGIRREMAKKMDMTLEELNVYAETHPETDVDVDKKVAQEARNLAEKNIVIVEGRVQFHFLPESYKIYIKVDTAEASNRIYKDLQDKQSAQKRNEGMCHSKEECEDDIIKRIESDRRRYKKYYNLDHTDESHYDLVIDTTDITAQQGAEQILDKLKDLTNFQ